MTRKNGAHVTGRRPDKDQPAGSEVTPERIRARAYELFLARNGGPGDERSDWLRAEAQLRGTQGAEPPDIPLINVLARGETLLRSRE